MSLFIIGKRSVMDIDIWDILAGLGLSVISYVFGYYNGKQIALSPDFLKRQK
jgi:hypothetical protein